jgi:hypothetical protein
MNKEVRNAFETLVGKSDERRLLVASWCKQEDTAETDLKYTE